MVSGTVQQIEDYLLIIKKEGKKLNFTIEKRKIKADLPKNKHYTVRNIDQQLLLKIENELPDQPWAIGVHKEIAIKLNLSNKLVNIGIQQLIAQGKFKRQTNGEVFKD